jgi:phenylpropionate dioxygenase-like ring-hydroxylating dioxygenase large terminal subunit
MLVNLWYVAEWSEKVKDKPVKVKMLGQNFVLFRDKTGKVHCLSDVCLHRGGSLGNGFIGTKNDNCVACPYHGWEFNSDGLVEYIPSLGAKGVIPSRARIDSYPTEERYGWIWVFMGDLDESKRYPLPPFPELDHPDWKAVSCEFTWDASAERVVENGIDLAHASFVHPGFGYPETAHLNKIINVERQEHWATQTNVTYPPQMKGGPFSLRRFVRKDKQETRVHNTVYMSGFCIRLHIELNPKMHTILLDANTPVDDHTTRSFLIQLRNFFKWDLFDGDTRRRTMQVFRQDAAVIEAASPYYLPETLENEMSVKQDRFMSVWREMRRKHIEKGWEIDIEEIKRRGTKKVFNIPSPGRRENPDKYMIETVPLVAVAQPLRIVIDDQDVA